VSLDVAAPDRGWAADPRVVGIVLAAGSGRRFGGRKQFAMVGGARLVDRALALVTAVAGPPVLALPPGVEWDGAEVAAVTDGGASRLDTLASAVACLDATFGHGVEVVLVHDCARPLATPAACGTVVRAVLDGGDAALCVWPTPDTIKAVDVGNARHPGERAGRLRHHGRDGLVVAQSPMAYRVDSLREALVELGGTGAGATAVEETIVIESRGGVVLGVPGDPWSHHVVEPRDLEIVEAILAADLPDHGWWRDSISTAN
jgi:2-C-methyl-D-erythritol 4-phosphate cytidylyltransferase